MPRAPSPPPDALSASSSRKSYRLRLPAADAEARHRGEERTGARPKLDPGQPAAAFVDRDDARVLRARDDPRRIVLAGERLVLRLRAGGGRGGDVGHAPVADAAPQPAAPHTPRRAARPGAPP